MSLTHVIILDEINEFCATQICVVTYAAFYILVSSFFAIGNLFRFFFFSKGTKLQSPNTRRPRLKRRATSSRFSHRTKIPFFRRAERRGREFFPLFPLKTRAKSLRDRVRQKSAYYAGSRLCLISSSKIYIKCGEQQLVYV